MTVSRLIRAAMASIMMLLAVPAEAVEPDEILADPALEARAQEIGEGLRCPVCRSESIEESNADLAGDLRVLVRERLQSGDTDTEVKQYLVNRYGEFILLKPRFTLANAAIWLAGPMLFLAGLISAVIFMRGRRADAASDRALSEEERTALERIVQQQK